MTDTEPVTEEAALPVEIQETVTEPTQAEEYEHQLEELRTSLTEAQVRAELLMCDVPKARLKEAAQIADRLCAAGMSPQQAAQAVVSEYPHLRTVKRELPKMAMSGSGRCDGFSEIRRIFSNASRVK